MSSREIFYVYIKRMPRTNIFQDIFYDGDSPTTVTDVKGLWPWPGNRRTVSHGTVVPFKNYSFSNTYVGYYLQSDTISDTNDTVIITYEFSYPIDLSDIEGFRIRYDSSQDLIFKIRVTDFGSLTGAYTGSNALSTVFSYNSGDPSFSTTDPSHIDLSTPPSGTNPNMSSLTK
jgi:hypothetical protein